ncbi:hypothetical protein [Vibrio campbellii]|uniref:Uncharacterized protein n=1 Tax=Vibrio campbellii (strain ATCC BAA-1116) TaxID=2902295 RepID=A7N431_VIBC1|nr:hypothetical protein [Vibrio campbellii]ABU73522.1 hypothetical protein VIBHAR_05619 [Vibrio campbellii ATCC BAA-1116]AGU98663.1 hypothetical protein M892_23520 [Vibrio campbellii ATCC BAA-1116]
MNIVVVPREQRVPTTGMNTAYLHVDRWNDFSFVTMFYMTVLDGNGKSHDIGQVKIGFKGQTIEKSTYKTLNNSFLSLPDGYFSVGQDVEYYKNMVQLPESTRMVLFKGLKDIAFDSSLIDLAQHEDVFRTSLLRDVSLSVIKGQFARVLDGSNPLTDFEFKFVRPVQEKMSGIELKFSVNVGDKPTTNIHAIIGRNGVGKTTLLNGMIEAVTSKGQSVAKFYDVEGWRNDPIDTDYFSSLVSVSFREMAPNFRT